MGEYRGVDTDPGWVMRRFKALEATVQELASAKRLVIATAVVQADLNSVTLPTTLGPTNFCVTNVPVPPGFNYALVTMIASAGTTFSGLMTNIIGVEPWANGVAGQLISNGTGSASPTSVASPYSSKFSVTPGGSFQLYAHAYASTSNTGSGNVHLSATVLFTRA